MNIHAPKIVSLDRALTLTAIVCRTAIKILI
jgi:hypothetical protein